MGLTKNNNYHKSLPLLSFLWNTVAIRKNSISFQNHFFNKYGNTLSVRLGREKWLMLSRDKEMLVHKDF